MRANKKPVRPLTADEAKTVEDRMGLVYHFYSRTCKAYPGLDQHTIKSLCHEALIEAVKVHSAKPDIQISSIMAVQLRHLLGEIVTRQKARKRGSGHTIQSLTPDVDLADRNPTSTLDDREQLDGLLSVLGTRDRMIVEKVSEGWTFRELAKEMKVSCRTVSVLYSLALDLVRVHAGLVEPKPLSQPPKPPEPKPVRTPKPVNRKPARKNSRSFTTSKVVEFTAEGLGLLEGRMRDVVLSRLGGESFQSIAIKLGVSRTRVFQVWDSAVRLYAQTTDK